MFDLDQPFLARALAAGLGLAVVAAPLGCIVVWRRMAYAGEALAQVSLLGVALGFALHVNTTAAVVLAALAGALIIGLAGRHKLLALDSTLGLLHHAALALAVIAISTLKGPGIDLQSYLFGDILAVGPADLLWIFGGGAFVLAVTLWLWRPMVRLSLHEDLAAAEGIDPRWPRLIFDLLLAATIAIAMKIVGALLVMAFLVVPAVAARPLAQTPERMAFMAAAAGLAGVSLGLWLSFVFDWPSGPSIVLSLTVLAAISLLAARIIRR